MQDVTPIIVPLVLVSWSNRLAFLFSACNEKKEIKHRINFTSRLKKNHDVFTEYCKVMPSLCLSSHNQSYWGKVKRKKSGAHGNQINNI